LSLDVAREAVGIALVVAGAGFFTAGALGLVRFPDLHSRLHALTKADNLGLGLVALGLAVTAPSGWEAVKLGLLWLVTLAASATATYLLAATALSGSPRSGLTRGEAGEREDHAG
jgi:multicomponent Na+:H+ antiporter subunit G